LHIKKVCSVIENDFLENIFESEKDFFTLKRFLVCWLNSSKAFEVNCVGRKGF
jgi:hypothetical protein